MNEGEEIETSLGSFFLRNHGACCECVSQVNSDLLGTVALLCSLTLYQESLAMKRPLALHLLESFFSLGCFPSTLKRTSQTWSGLHHDAYYIKFACIYLSLEASLLDD